MKIQVYRNSIPNAQLPVTEQAVFTHQLMGEHKIILPFVSPIPVDVQIGDATKPLISEKLNRRFRSLKQTILSSR